MQKNRRAPPSAADGSGEVALARVLRRLRDDVADGVGDGVSDLTRE